VHTQVLIEQESEMLKGQDQEWVRRQIEEAREAITEEIRLATQRAEIQGFKKFLEWLRTWSLVGVSLSIFVALVVFTGTGWLLRFFQS
jgi:5-bromo-4-chloroindolyl phosphate hydrolysis protein